MTKTQLILCALLGASIVNGVPYWCEMNHRSSLAGTAVSDSQLDAITALDCGQSCSTAGQTACADSLPCASSGTSGALFYNIYCDNPGATCGSCAGGTNIVCAGSLSLNGTLCYEYAAACCTVTSKCQSQMNIATNWNCNCVSAMNAPISVGKRIMCAPQYNFAGCQPPGG